MDRPIPDPEPNVETQAFFDAAKQGKLLIRRCLACNERHFFPRTICPFCFSDNTEWEEVSGRGQIYSCSVQRRVEPPYCIAYVTLEDGPTVLSNIVDCDLDRVRIGDKVRVVFHRSVGGQAVPMFAPAEA
jgi:uncharacterized protein